MVKVTTFNFLISFNSLRYAIFSKIGQAIQNWLQIDIFDLWFDLWPWHQRHTILFILNQPFLAYDTVQCLAKPTKRCIANRNLWPFFLHLMIKTRSNFFVFKFSLLCILYGAIFSKIGQVIQDLLQNEIFDLLFWPLTLRSRSQNILIFYFYFYGYYVVQFLAKSVKPFRIYRKIKYLILTFNFGVKVKGKQFSLVFGVASLVQIWTRSDQLSMRKTYPATRRRSRRRRRTTTTTSIDS